MYILESSPQGMMVEKQPTNKSHLDMIKKKKGKVGCIRKGNDFKKWIETKAG